MFGEPVAKIAPLLGMLCEVERIAESLSGSTTLDDKKEIKDREESHHLLRRILQTSGPLPQPHLTNNARECPTTTSARYQRARRACKRTTAACQTADRFRRSRIPGRH